MDILEIDVTSYAARPAWVAAAALYDLLETGEDALRWWCTGPRDLDGMERDASAMAAYVVQRRAMGETLFRWNVLQGRCAGAWTALKPAQRLGYDLFATTVLTVADRLGEAQKEAEKALDLATRPSPKPPALEDTIFEPEEGLGTMRPEAVAALKQIAEYEAAQRKQEAGEDDHCCPVCLKKFEPADLCATDIELGTCHAACLEGSPTVNLETGDPVNGPVATYRYDELAPFADPPPDRDRDPGSAPPVEIAQPAPAPMSIGEAPPAQPVNKGGRGKRKAK